MGIGTSIFLIAVGAILKYAVTASVSGVKLETVGLILMIVGVAGLALSLIMMAMARRREVAVEERPLATHREPAVRERPPAV
jgi:hypothetical protein